MKKEDLPISDVQPIDFSVEVWEEYSLENRHECAGFRLGRLRGTSLISLQILSTADLPRADFIETEYCGHIEGDPDAEISVGHAGLYDGGDLIKRLRAFCDMYDAITKKGLDQ